ncbi:MULTISPECIES: PspA/IM30 family protein [Microcystis]|jgi:phage shock protein A|uniref:PspA/IM30 family protein n=1 Tax=Microcystis viridis FACHB-1342 TaxID=2692900 RepID=A0ABR8G9Z5_MICVR|nr:MULTISPECIES: PspA/IM30 family protein [Microcystis]MBD2599950.1 PspA/IM30 family protein [Microcystis viridis FACHB-1342]MCA2624628.1 PspA/IM30 family protein [Microcystis sp. M19BS1]MCA2631892.1 PspA/IM30 family protein [Microcystis sp. M20BS1]MDB9388181.1 PspA/IM30 family protein [Microcystis aeruginosa CS-583]ODV39548.1 Phage shock protein A [Microcystis aeruginosa NIES-98]
MRDDLSNLRSSIIEVIALQKRAEQQYNQAQAEVLKWEERVKLALDKGDESLAREANIKKKHHINTANIIKNQLEKLNIQVDKLKEKLPILERKINEKSIGSIDTIYPSAFERMEAKFMQSEASSQADGELVDIDSLEASSDVDDELALLKAQMSGGALPGTTSNQSDLPPANTLKDSAVDAEIEELRSKLKEL